MVQRTRALRGRSALAQILQELEAQQRRRRQRVGTGGISPAAAYAVTEAERRAAEGPIVPPSPTAPEQIVPGEPKPNILQQAFGVVNAPFRAAQNIVAPVNRFMAKIIPGEQPIERGERPPTALESVLTGLGAITSRIAAPVVGSIAQTATKLAGHEAESKRIAESMAGANLLLRPESVLETVKESTKFPTGLMGALEMAAAFPVLGVGAKVAGVAKGTQAVPRIAQRAYKYAPEAVPTTEALLAKPADPGWIGATAEKLTNWHIGHVFPLRPFLRGVNPSLDMQGTTEGRALLLGNHLDDFADNTWAVISGRAREIHSRAFRFDSNDNVINAVVRRSGANPKPKIQQLLSMRGDYALSPEQRQFAALYDEIVNWTKAQEAAEGILIRERTLLPGETYIHRKVTSIRGQEVYGGARKGISGKQPFQRRLVYDMVDDAINAGVNFDKDMVASLEVVYKGGMINIRNARMARLLQAIPGARTTAVLGRVREAREKALLNWRNESRKLRQLRAVYPAKVSKELIDEAVDKVALARVAVTETKAAFKAKRAYLLEKHPGEGAIRGLGGWYFPEAVAKTVNAHFENQMPQLLKAIKTASSLSVSLGTTIDIGWSMNQGLPLLFNNTRAWAQSAVWSAREIAKPQAWGRFLSKQENYDAAMRAVTQGKVLLEDIGEMVEQAGATGLLTTAGPLGKIPVLGGAYKKTIGKAFERGGAGFTTAGNVARVLTYEALEPLALRRGAGALEDLGSFVNKMTGTLSTRALGAANKQRGVETMLLFAPRFTRAAFALAGDTLRGGLRGELARNSLAKLALGGTITYVVAAELLGQRPMLDMRPVSEGGDGGKAFTVEAFGQRIGWGGPFRMIAGVLFHATAAAATDPTALVKIDTSKNPFLKSLRGRVSPVLSATWDTTTGRNYIGEPTDFGSDPLQWTKEVLASRIVPFWAEAMLFDEPPSLMGGAIGISGLKNYPVSFWDRRTDLRNEIAQQQYGRPWDELLPDEQIRLERSSPDLKAATDIARKVSLERADETGVMIADYGNDAEDARERLLDKLNTAQREFEANGLGSRGTRESIADKIDDALAFYRQEWDRIEGKYPKVREYFDGLPQPEKQTVAHIAYAEYIATVLAEPTLIDQYGDYQYDRRQELEEAFRNKWGIEVYAAIQMRKKESQIDYPPIVQELLAGRENPVFRAYWEVDKILLERVGQAALYPLYQEYKQADSYMREQMQELYPVFKQIDSAVTQARRLMRERNANLDRYMFRFGKTGTVVHKDNIGREEMILDFG